MHEVAEVPHIKPLPNVAIVVGHDDIKSGAITYNYIREFDFCYEVAKKAIMLNASRRNIVLLKRNEDLKSYSAQMRDIAKRCEILKIDIAIELHLNASGVPEARGVETLVLNKDDTSAYIGQMFAYQYGEKFKVPLRGFYKNYRGVKGISPYERGGGFLHQMSKRGISSFIFEPFFCDYKNRESERFLEDIRVGTTLMAEYLIATIAQLR